MKSMNPDVTIKAYICVNVMQKIADILANAVLTIYLINKGLSYVEITSLWSIYLASVFIFDFPSGAVADKTGRVKTYAYGVIISAVSYCILMPFERKVFFVCSYFFKGIGAALMSGSLQAWLGSAYSSGQYKEYVGKMKLYEIFFSIPIVLIMANATTISAKIILFVVIAIQIIIAFVAVIFLPENKGVVESFFKVSLDGIQTIIQTKQLMAGLLMSIISYVAFTASNLFWQPFAEKIGIHIRFFPLFSAMNLLISSLSSYIISKAKLKSAKYLNISLVFFLLGFIIFYLRKKDDIWSLLLFMIFYSIGEGISFISVSCIINESTSYENKATIFSVISSLSSLFTVAFQPIVGLWMQTGLNFMFQTMIYILILLGVVLNICIRRRK